MNTAVDWLAKIRALPLPPTIKVMNVCGGHERSITTAGLRKALPSNIELVPGPGCPVCICPEEDIYEAIQLALHEGVILCAYGDMLRVPVNAPKSEPRSLEQARAAGGDVRPVASPLEAARIASDNPTRTVVFLAAGFETTTAPAAALLVQGAPDNLLVLMSGRRTWPAVSMLLDSGEPGFEALIAPGHVATVMGPEEWEFVPREHGLPTAIAGFSPESLLAALYSVLRQKLEGRCFLDNCYPQVVRPGGNTVARRHLEQTMDIVAGNWRGIGPIPESGYELREAYAAHDSRRRLPSYTELARKRAGEMPPGLRLRESRARPHLPQRVPPLWARLHAAPPDRSVHGLRRRRLPDLVGRRRARKRLGRDGRRRVPRPDDAGKPPANRMSAPRVAKRALLRGRVQGVGFRPFVHRLAHEHGLDGHVRNLRGEVEVLVAGPAAQVERFLRRPARTRAAARPTGARRADTRSCRRPKPASRSSRAARPRRRGSRCRPTTSPAPTVSPNSSIRAIAVTAIRSSTARSADPATR